MLDLRAIARALGGEVAGGQVLAPGPGHSPKDRSMAVQLNPASANGFVVFSHAGDDFKLCRDHVTRLLGIDHDAWKQHEPSAPRPRSEPDKAVGDIRRDLALWRRRGPIVEDSLVWRYLRETRAYGGPIPATIGYLPARGEHPPCMIASIGMADEPEPGVLAIRDSAVQAVHLTRLKPDGRGKAETAADKVTIGRGSVGTPIVVAATNDLLGLAVTEGIEDALSVHAATGLGSWAAASAGRMPALAKAVPGYVECVTIFGHRDPAGERGARELATRLVSRGVETVLKFLEAEPAL